ncbi:MAG: GNAT family N-acetyltransferase [Blautia marasmi]
MEFTKEKARIAYYNEEGKMLAEITFPAVNKNTVNINHTFVDEPARAGIAGKLMQAAAQYLDESGRKVLPTCSYAVGWFAKHPEYSHLLIDGSEE